MYYIVFPRGNRNFLCVTMPLDATPFHLPLAYKTTFTDFGQAVFAARALAHKHGLTYTEDVSLVPYPLLP